MADDRFPLNSDLTRTSAEQDSWYGRQPAGAKPLGPAQWLRRIDLTVYAKAGGDKADGLDLSALRVDFRLTKQMNMTPNYLSAKVYNLSPETIRDVKQYHRVQLSAGHITGNFGMIFDGTVVLYIVGKENPVDSYLEIIAGDADTVLSNATLNLTFPPGTLPQQHAETAIKQVGLPVAKVDLGKGQQPTLRHSHYLGSFTRFMRNLTNATDTNFFVDDGKAYVIPTNGYLQGEIVVLSPTTGLVGIPRVTPNGIEAVCLLNPKLRICSLVQIDDQWISDVAFEPGNKGGGWDNSGGTGGSGTSSAGKVEQFSSYQPQPFGATGKAFTKAAASTSPTGIYKIVQLNHYGDTRGNPWYSEFICAAAGANGEMLKYANLGTALNRSAVPAPQRPAGYELPPSPPPPPPPPRRDRS